MSHSAKDAYRMTGLTHIVLGDLYVELDGTDSPVEAVGLAVRNYLRGDYDGLLENEGEMADVIRQFVDETFGLYEVDDWEREED